MFFSGLDLACRIPSEMWPSESTMTLQVWLTPGCMGRLNRIKECQNHLGWKLLSHLHPGNIYPFILIWFSMRALHSCEGSCPAHYLYFSAAGIPYRLCHVVKRYFLFSKAVSNSFCHSPYEWMLSQSWTHASLLWSYDALYQVSTIVGTERLCWCPAWRESPSISSLEVTPCLGSAVGSHGPVQTSTQSSLLGSRAAWVGPLLADRHLTVPVLLDSLTLPSCKTIRLSSLDVVLHFVILQGLPACEIVSKMPPSSWHCFDPAPRSFTFPPTLSCLVATLAVVLPWVVGGLTLNRYLLLCGGIFSGEEWTGEEHPVSRAREAAKPPMLRVVPTTRDYPTKIDPVKVETPCPRDTRSKKGIKGWSLGPQGAFNRRWPAWWWPLSAHFSRCPTKLLVDTQFHGLYGCRKALRPHLGRASWHHSTSAQWVSHVGTPHLVGNHSRCLNSKIKWEEKRLLVCIYDESDK